LLHESIKDIAESTKFNSHYYIFTKGLNSLLLSLCESLPSLFQKMKSYFKLHLTQKVTIIEGEVFMLLLRYNKREFKSY